MSKWFIKNKKAKDTINSQNFGLNKVELQILLNRGIDTPEKIKEFLFPGEKYLFSPILLKGMIKAGNILSKVLENKEKIRIVGDYDVDGVMSTSILLKGLKDLEYNVDYTIPHRIYDGYGINKSIVDKAIEDQVDILLTCDNGISAFDAIEYARENSLTVIVTDHHEVPIETKNNEEVEILPRAHAIINPKLRDCKYPNKNLCGAGISYKLMEYLYTVLGRREEMSQDLLTFASIATICDVMILLGENRSLVSLGLKLLNQSESLALTVLKKVCSISGQMEAYHMGFIIGPTINSAGRLDRADKAVELFSSNDIKRVEELAIELRELNTKRQAMTEEGIQRIQEQIKCLDLEKETFFLLLDKKIHESIAGIIAGRIKSIYNRPTIIMSKAENGFKGSGRSIEGFNIVEEIRKHKDLLLGFGGHPMACGLSVNEENYHTFKQDLLTNISLDPEDVIPIVRIDAPLKLGQVNIDFIQKINSFAPFGNGNERPLFGAKDLKIQSLKLLGKNNNVLRVDLIEADILYRGILFKEAFETFNVFNKNKNRLIDIVYSPSINTFRQEMTIQFEIKDFRITEKLW